MNFVFVLAFQRITTETSGVDLQIDSVPPHLPKFEPNETDGYGIHLCVFTFYLSSLERITLAIVGIL